MDRHRVLLEAALALAIAAGSSIQAARPMGSLTQTPQEQGAGRAANEEAIEKQLQLGYLEFGHGDPRKALKAFHAALAVDATAPVEAVAGVAFTHLQMGRLQEALDWLKAHPDHLKNCSGLYLLVGRALYGLGRKAEGLAALKNMTEPQSDTDHYVRGCFGMLVGHSGRPAYFAQALTSYSKAIQASKRPRAVYYYECMHAAGHTHNRSRVEHLARTMQARWPRSVLTWRWSGFGFLNIENHDKGIDAYRKAIVIDDSDPTSHLNLGLMLERKGKLINAMREYEAALKLNPRYARAQVNIGVLHDRGKRFKDARAAYEKAVVMDPRLWEAQSNLGTLLAQQADYAEAIEPLKRAIAIRPDYPWTHFSLGQALRGTGRPVEGIKAYRQALSLHPKVFLIRFALATALRTDGLAKEAAEEFRAALQLKPDDKECLTMLVGILEGLGEFKQIRTALEKALESRSNDSRLLNKLAWFLVDPDGNPKQWDAKAAIPLARRAVRLTKNSDPHILDTLAVALFRSGDIEGAIKAQEQTLQAMNGKNAGTYTLKAARAALKRYQAARARR